MVAVSVEQVKKRQCFCFVLGGGWLGYLYLYIYIDIIIYHIYHYF